MPIKTRPIIAILGGTGKEGGGLALRWAHSGYSVIIGGRSKERAVAAAKAISAKLGPTASVTAELNLDAAVRADIVVLTVPYSAQQSTVLEVRAGLVGKILVDVTVPLSPPMVSRVQLPEGGSAVDRMQRLLGNEVKVVSAFQNIAAHHLVKLDHDVGCDVLVCADDPAAADIVVQLAEDIGMCAWNAGPLANSAVAEGLTSILIGLKRRLNVSGPGIRVIGI
jgi:NADPH-dependent F420 reductase